ncbi:MAG TPA: protein-glutamate O-methyltransferase CheR [Pyrinomonadaceae bacterium]|nr:protein-glutamate O-methyltransferase CheR [Pyrinomonadaceae bacterium]
MHSNMGGNLDNLGLRRGAEGLLRDLIHDRAGLYFDDARLDTLTEKLAPLVIERGFNSFLDYYYLLKFDADAADEWRNLTNALSVQETYFWREMDQIHALAEEIMPKLVAANGMSPIQIWSAACATGEEPLTIAIRLNENGWFDRAKIEIYGSDVSSAALDRARRGRFRERAFRSLPQHLKEKYFEVDGKEWLVAKSIHEKIRWHQVNLLEKAEISNLARASVIFCRNVFIYFSPDAIRKVVDSFADKMKTPAFLFAGAAESLLKVTDDFELEEIGGCFVYVKRR